MIYKLNIEKSQWYLERVHYFEKENKIDNKQQI